MQWLVRLRGIPPDRRALLLEAALRLSWYKLALFVLPFRWIAPRLGRPVQEPSRRGSADQLADARRIGWAVSLMARKLPWHSRCLVRAVTAKVMLQRRGLRSTLYLGVRREDDRKVSSHAWLRYGDLPLVGGLSADYTVLATFADD
ncbi:MAG: lasso peptide biosynthesis B2 protein [Gemmatimonadales bacterium]|jgi:hypothetical protein